MRYSQDLLGEEFTRLVFCEQRNGSDVLLSAFANRYVRTILGVPTLDTTSGFRCWRREALERVPLDRITSDGYAFLVELAWQATRAGCRIREVPITFTERRQGASKMSGRVVLESALLPWRLRGTI
jgi:dolichol-phosphate mannosyltransferase